MKVADLTRVVSTLPVRPARAPREGSHGYVLRIAAENGLRSSGLVFDASGVPAHGQPRLCPACLGERGCVWRAEWERVGEYWCREHLHWLVDACPHCGCRIRWRRVTAHSCGCGFALRNFEREPVSAAVLHLPEEHAADRALVRWLGGLSCFGLGAKAWKRAQSEVPADVRGVITAGAEMLAAWPGTFERVLDTVRVEQDGSAPQAINSALPGLVKAISRLRSAAHRSFVLDALAGYVDRSQHSGRPLIGRNPQIRQAAVSITKTARSLGISGRRFRKAILDALPDRGVMGVTPFGRTRGALLPQDAARVRASIDDGISMSHAADLLGLSAKRVGALVSGGRLASSNRLVLRSQCAALSREVWRAASSAPSESGLTRLAEAVRLLVPLHLTCQFFQSAVAGDIKTFRTTGGYDRPGELLIERAEAVRWSALQEPDLGTALTVPQAARLLGLKQEVAYHLVRVGLIETESKKVKRRNGQLVSTEELERFAGQVEPLTKAAARAGVNPRNGLAWVKETSRVLVSGPRVDGGRQYFVRITATTEQPEETPRVETLGAASAADLQENAQ